MEEYIKILEQEINDIYVGCGATITNAIENLIKGYRKLEKRNKRQFKLLQKRDKNSIPKSKVKEIIEELDNWDSEFYQRVVHHNERTLTELVQNILQELMEDK